MKEYPKIPRFDHPVVDGDIFEMDDLVVFEKVDGSNFRFSLYDERFSEMYSEEMAEFTDGDVVVGTKSAIRGCLCDPIESFDGGIRRAVAYLKDVLDRSCVRDLHEAYESPLVFFAENMVFHTLDYEYNSNPPPPLVGFDVYVCACDTGESAQGNPYEEGFDGFLPVEGCQDIFERLNIPFAPRKDVNVEGLKTREDDVFPESEFAGVIVEGVVLRSDSLGERVKIVRDEFEELNKDAFGLREDQAETGEEVIVARYCTNARIRKIIRKMVVDEGYDFGLHLNDELYPRVYEDIWEENWHEIKDLDVEFTPSEVKPLVAERCIEVLRRMNTNSKLNEADPHELWSQF